MVKAVCLECRGSSPALHSSFKEIKSSPRKDSILWVASVTERAWSQITRARFLNYVSRGQCHLTHLTILMAFAWPSLAYMWPQFILFLGSHVIIYIGLMLKVIYHPLYSMNKFVSDKSKLPQDGAQVFPYMG